MTTTNHHDELDVRKYTDREAMAAIEDLERKTTDTVNIEVLLKGTMRYGKGFIAYLLTVDVNRLPHDEILSIYSACYVMTAASEEGAMRGLMYGQGLKEGLRVARSTDGEEVKALLSKVSSAQIQQRIAATSVLVNIGDEWHVFDRSLLDELTS